MLDENKMLNEWFIGPVHADGVDHPSFHSKTGAITISSNKRLPAGSFSIVGEEHIPLSDAGNKALGLIWEKSEGLDPTIVST